MKKKILDKSSLIKKIQKHKSDVGSSEVQISILTDRIKYITEHLKSNRKDHSARRGLVNLVSTRKKLLTYLKRKNVDKYESTIKELGIRK